MATNGLVTPVVDRPGFHNRFGGAEDVLDCPECFVDVSDRLGVVEAISAHHPEPVVACFGFDLLLINREMIVPLNFQVATVKRYEYSGAQWLLDGEFLSVLGKLDLR